MIQHSLLQNNEDKDLFIEIVLAGLGVSSALFFCSIVKTLDEEYEATATQLGVCYGVTPGAAIYHLKRLQLKDFVSRNGYRCWSYGNYMWQWKKERLNEIKPVSGKYI